MIKKDVFSLLCNLYLLPYYMLFAKSCICSLLKICNAVCKSFLSENVACYSIDLHLSCFCRCGEYVVDYFIVILICIFYIITIICHICLFF